PDRAGQIDAARHQVSVREGEMVNLARWLVAVSAVTALVYTTVPSLSGPTAEVEGPSNKAPGTCPAGAKQANLKFTVNDMSGQKISLESCKGKVIVLDFWATWCPPCKAEIPGFVELQQTYGD